MKILYGIPSEGMGHATRSKVVVEYLLGAGHDVRMVSSDRAYQFLSQHFGDRVYQIKGFHLAYRHAEVSIRKTILKTLQEAPKNLLENFTKYSQVVKDFKPDVVISDFESFTFFFAKYHQLPLISIDNMQVIDRCQLNIHIPAEEKRNYILAKQIVKAKVYGAQAYLISSFFQPSIKKSNTYFVPPILRKEIVEAKATRKNHVLVYQTSTSQKDLVSVLQSLPQENFIVYGLNKDENHLNVRLKTFSEKGFIDDLSSCKAVLTNGGFSLISEAVYLKKPICSMPIQNQFEQFVNASYVQQLNYGRHFNQFNSDDIKAFLYDLPSFEKSISTYHQDGNTQLFLMLEETMIRLTSKA